MTGTVYSYIRFSSQRQAAGHSVERQMAYAARWAADNGMVLDESLTLRDEGLSAYHQRHVRSGALGAFLAGIEAGRVTPGSVLVVEGLDRLSRAEPTTAQAQLAQIVNAGVSVVTASDSKVYSRESLKASPMDLVYSLLVMIRAHEESDTKSKRVKAALRKQCEGWLNGTWRGCVRTGTDPAWVRLVDGKWELVPESVAAVQLVLDMYRQGHGATRIVTALRERQLSLTDRNAYVLQIFRLIKQRALIGEKEIEADGTIFHLPGYYPPLMTREQWDELQALSAERGRRPGKGEVPNILTGMRVTVCGYCGNPMVAQNMKGRTSADGRLRDCYRRMRCIGNADGTGCSVGGSCNSAPLERVVMNFCSDLLNLKSLLGEDRSAKPRAQLEEQKQVLSEVEQKLKRLTTLFLASGDDAPETFVEAGWELQAERDRTRKSIAQLERAVTASARTNVDDAHAMWLSLRDGVEQQDVEARLKTRQLVADTFERIVVYHKGNRISSMPEAPMQIRLFSKGGIARTLCIDKDGEFLGGLDIDVSTPLPTYAEAMAMARERAEAAG